MTMYCDTSNIYLNPNPNFPSVNISHDISNNTNLEEKGISY